MARGRGDKDPSLTLRWPRPETVTGLRIQVNAALASARAQRVRVESSAGSRTGTLDATGRLSFASLVSDSITVHLEGVVPSSSRDPYSLNGSLLPVGVSELTVDGAVRPTTPAFGVTVPCNVGPILRVGQAFVRTTATTDRSTLQKLRQAGPEGLRLQRARRR